MAEDTAVQDLKQHREHRYQSMAHIRIHGFDGRALIRNINNSGCCMASKTYVAIHQHEKHKMEVIPEDASGISTIMLDVEVRWTRTTVKNFASGLRIIHGGAALRAYLAYLEKTHQTVSK